MSHDQDRGEIVVDLDAVRHNVRRLREIAAPARVLAVVKADGYGHGLLPTARAARSAGAEWLGVAVLEEA
ncbi:MAG: alanine racemase, partial [Nocardioidaceae bacterium]